LANYIVRLQVVLTYPPQYCRVDKARGLENTCVHCLN